VQEGPQRWRDPGPAALPDILASCTAVEDDQASTLWCYETGRRQGRLHWRHPVLRD